METRTHNTLFVRFRLAVVVLIIFGATACGGERGNSTASDQTVAATAPLTAYPTAPPAAPRASPAPAPATTLAPNPTQVVAPPPAPKPEPKVPAGVANAARSAKSYLNYSAFSRSGLIKQLAYEGYTTKETTAAVDSLDVDYNAEAVESAEDYLNYSSFSRSGLVDQLEYEGFTPAQAEHGASQAYNG